MILIFTVTALLLLDSATKSPTSTEHQEAMTSHGVIAGTMDTVIMAIPGAIDTVTSSVKEM